MKPKPKINMDDDSTWLLYDGKCPFCSRYIRLIRLKSSMGNLELIDARRRSEYVAEVQKAGLDINQGMILKYGQRLYHGNHCINMLALLSPPIGFANKINAWIFKSPTRAKLLYPLLRGGRNILLWILGRKKIDTPTKVAN